MNVLVVVASQTGRTLRMAEEFAVGAREAGAHVEVVSAEDASADAVESADVLALGSGVHMGGIESSMRVFFERIAPLWMQGKLVGRIGAAFASAGNGGRGGGELALISLWAHLAEHGLLTVPMHNRLAGYREAGCHWGPLAWTNPRDGVAGPTDGHLEAARSHGEHVVATAARWLAGSDG
jgi:NAD(P)H dehydrogenase (quinone)